MEQLTQMELMQMEELLMAEDLAIKKLKFYEDNCQDTDLKSIFQDGAMMHRMHMEGLMGQLRSLNGKAN